MTPAHYEYTIRPGDSLTRIIYDMYGWTPHSQPDTYRSTLKGVLALNPHIANPDRVQAGTVLRLPEHPTSTTLQQVRPIVLKQQGFLSNQLLSPAEKERVTALAWLAHNSNWLTIPGGIATGMTTTLLSPSNRQLLTDIGDLYAEFKKSKITRTAFKAQREAKLEQFRRNIGPMFERLLYPKQGVTGAMRQGINLLPTHLAQREEARLLRIVKHASKAGVLLTGIGLSASCIEIANTVSQEEKNEIFVDTIASTAAGLAFGLYLISSPIGWGTAIVLAAGSAATSYGIGKLAAAAYDTWGNKVDLVNGTGVNKVCR